MATVSDNFNRPNEELGASANWTEDSGDWEVVSNEAYQGTFASVYHKARWVGTPLAGDDQYCEILVVTTAIGAGCRQTTDTNVSGYTAIAFATEAYYLIDLTAGSANVLGSWGTGATGVTLRVEAESTTVRMKVDGTERVSTTDSSYSSGAVGMFDYNTGKADDWEAGDIGGGATYYQSCAGTLTFTGGLVKKTSKRLSGSITPTGSLGTSASFKKALSGAMTFAGTLSTSLVMRQALSGAISFVGDLATQYTAGPGGAWVRWIDHRLLKWRKKFE